MKVVHVCISLLIPAGMMFLPGEVLGQGSVDPGLVESRQALVDQYWRPLSRRRCGIRWLRLELDRSGASRAEL